MTSLSIPFQSSSKTIKVWFRRIVIGVTIALVAFTLTAILSTVAQIGLGAMISEKTLGRAGIADSNLLLGRSGTNTTLSILGFAPIVSTQPTTALGVGGGIPTATLWGRVTNMNGLPTATGYFQWGYAVGALTSTTTTFAIGAAGDYSLAITGFNQNNRVYYRFVTDADGTAYGTVIDFLIPSGTGGYLLKNILRVLIAASILVGVARLGGSNPIRMLVLATIGLIAFVIISASIETML